jgi:hypothetical protein
VAKQRSLEERNMNFSKPIIAVSLFLIQSAVWASDNEATATIEPPQVHKVYYLDQNFYKKAGEWVLRRNGGAKGAEVRSTISGFLSAIGVDPGTGINALFLSDPRQGRLKPLLHLKAPKNVHERMAQRHKDLTGTRVEEVTAEEIALMEEMRDLQQQKPGGNPFAE